MKSQNLSRAVRLRKDENDLRPKGLLLPPFMTYSLTAINQPWIQQRESHSLHTQREREGKHVDMLRTEGEQLKPCRLKGYIYIWVLFSNIINCCFFVSPSFLWLGALMMFLNQEKKQTYWEAVFIPLWMICSIALNSIGMIYLFIYLFIQYVSCILSVLYQ